MMDLTRLTLYAAFNAAGEWTHLNATCFDVTALNGCEVPEIRVTGGRSAQGRVHIISPALETVFRVQKHRSGRLCQCETQLRQGLWEWKTRDIGRAVTLASVWTVIEFERQALCTVIAVLPGLKQSQQDTCFNREYRTGIKIVQLHWKYTRMFNLRAPEVVSRLDFTS